MFLKHSIVTQPRSQLDIIVHLGPTGQIGFGTNARWRALLNMTNNETIKSESRFLNFLLSREVKFAVRS